MLITKNGYPKFYANDPDDREKMKPAYEQILACIKEKGLTYNETDAIFSAVKNVLLDVMTIPKSS